MADKIKLRRDTLANWEAVNPILDAGELGLITDRNTAKFGDGTTEFNSLLSMNGVPEGWINVKDFGAKGDGITDDTQAVQAALDTGKTIFIPEGTYLVSELYWTGRNNIIGSGFNTVLRNSISNTTLLWINNGSDWKYPVIENLALVGNSNNDGINFLKSQSGRVTFRNLHFLAFDKAIFKSKGNISNNFYNCFFNSSSPQPTNFHIYAEASTSPTMHAGGDIFIGCRFAGSKKAAYYIDNKNVVAGAIKFIRCSIEGNEGFGLFLKGFGYRQVSTISIDSCHFEKNASLPIVIINETEYVPAEIGGSSSQISIYNTRLQSVNLAGCQIYTDNCNLYSAEGDRKPKYNLSNSIMVNNNSLPRTMINNVIINSVKNIVSDELVNGIFMPPRTKIANTYKDVLLATTHYNTSTPQTLIGENETYTSTQVEDSINHTYSSEFVITNGNPAIINYPTMTADNSRWINTINIKLISGNLKIDLIDSSENTHSINLSEHFLNKWVSLCLFGWNYRHLNFYPVKLKISDTTGTNSTFRINDFQIFKFTTTLEIVDMLNSNIVAL